MITGFKILTIAFMFYLPQEQVTTDKTVVINELMPTNSTIPDQSKEYDDWIELYNMSPGTVDLSGYFLTDDRKNLTRWTIPDGTKIGPGEFLIIWADQDTIQPGLHANFKLSADGEEVLLVKPDRTIADEVKFRPQKKELTFARNPDGTGKFAWQNPTPGKSNNIQ